MTTLLLDQISEHHVLLEDDLLMLMVTHIDDVFNLRGRPDEVIVHWMMAEVC